MKKLLMKSGYGFLLCVLPVFAQAQSLVNHIPASAQFVLTIHSESITKKIPASELGKLHILARDTFGETRPQDIWKNVLRNPVEGGIDLKSNIYYTAEVTDTTDFTYLYLPLADAAKFTQFIQNEFKEVDKDATLQPGGGYQTLSGKGMQVTWNSSFAIISTHQNVHSYRYRYEEDDDYSSSFYVQQNKLNQWRDSITNIIESVEEIEDELTATQRHRERLSVDSWSYERLEEEYAIRLATMEANKDSIEEAKKRAKEAKLITLAYQRIDQLMNLDAKGSISTNSSFLTSMSDQQKEDVSYWLNYGTTLKSLIKRMGFSERELRKVKKDVDDLIDNNYMITGLDFQQDKAIVNSTFDYNQNVYNYISGVYRNQFNKEFYKYIKGDNLTGIMSMNINTQKTGEATFAIMKKIYGNMPGNDGKAFRAATEMVEMLLDKQVLYGTLTGDFCLAITDLKKNSFTYTDYEYDSNFNSREVVREKTEVLPEFIGLASLGNRANLQKIINVIESFEGVRKINDNLYTFNNRGIKGFNLYLKLTDKVVIITNNESLANDGSFKEYPKNEQISSDMRKRMDKHSFFLFVDGDKLNNPAILDMMPREGKVFESVTSVSKFYWYNLPSDTHIQKSRMEIELRKTNYIDNANAVLDILNNPLVSAMFGLQSSYRNMLR